LGIVTKITSTGKTTFVTFNKLGNKNATNWKSKKRTQEKSLDQ
jgi:hypothetical protein